MSNEDGTVHIVYNGELYNFRELKEQFKLAERYNFRSRTDTEVLLRLYEEFGVEMAKHLNGMFGIAIWDTRTETLHLIRDHAGIKPLFYQQDENYFRFGSEIKAIIADEIAIGVVNNKTTAVRIIPVPGKEVGDKVVYGGLLGEAPIMPVSRFSSAEFIRLGGRIPAPIISLRN